MVAARVLVAVSAQSVARVEGQVTLPQLRVLVMIASRGTQNVTSVAQGLGVHASNATRTCDKLVEAVLIHRREDPPTVVTYSSSSPSRVYNLSTL